MKSIEIILVLLAVILLAAFLSLYLLSYFLKRIVGKSNNEKLEENLKKLTAKNPKQ